MPPGAGWSVHPAPDTARHTLLHPPAPPPPAAHTARARPPPRVKPPRFTGTVWAPMSTIVPVLRGVRTPRGARVAVIAARWNPDIVDELLAGCARRLRELGLRDRAIETHRVPGAYELPF